MRYELRVFPYKNSIKGGNFLDSLSLGRVFVLYLTDLNKKVKVCESGYHQLIRDLPTDPIDQDEKESRMAGNSENTGWPLKIFLPS